MSNGFPTSGFAASPPPPPPDPYAEYWIESANFWAGYIGHERPPLPSYREIDGKKVLGRWMDPWLCQIWMEYLQNAWGDLYKPLYINFGITAFVTDLNPILIPIYLPVAIYLWHRHRTLRKLYLDLYYAQQEMLQTDKPMWVPYPKTTLEKMRYSPAKWVYP